MEAKVRIEVFFASGSSIVSRLTPLDQFQDAMQQFDKDIKGSMGALIRFPQNNGKTAIINWDAVNHIEYEVIE